MKYWYRIPRREAQDLEERGYVVREVDAEDGHPRFYEVHCTDEQIAAHMDRWDAR